MNLQQHVPAKRIREFLHGELSKYERNLVGLHLSYCLSCQKEQDEVLLDEANLELCGMASRSLTEATAHVDPSVFADFWSGRIADPHQLEEISEHCLICDLCRHQRYEIWLHNRSRVETQRYVTTIMGVLAVIATRARKHRRIVVPAVAAIALVTTAFIFSITGETFLPNSLSVASRSDEIPPVALNSFPRVPTIRNSPTAVIYKVSNAGKPGELAIVKPTGTTGSTNTPSLRTAAVRKPEKLWAELARVQRISLSYPVDDEPFRGADSEQNQEKRLLPVVISRTESTGIHIQLPGESKQGKYLISLFEPEQIDTKLADDETVTADGKELAVSLDLTKVVPGEYVLLVERETEGSDEKEFLGYFPVFLIAPATN
jgi:hypothetical protein